MDAEKITKDELKQAGRLERICRNAGAPSQFVTNLTKKTNLKELSKMSDATIRATLAEEFGGMFKL